MSQHETTSTDAEEFLAHYGVKGMRWGVRKARTGELGVRAAMAKRVGRGQGTRVEKLHQALNEYTVGDLVKRRGLQEASKRRGKVLEDERNRLARGEATSMDILKAYGTQSVLTVLASMYDSKKTTLSNRPASRRK